MQPWSPFPGKRCNAPSQKPLNTENVPNHFNEINTVMIESWFICLKCRCYLDQIKGSIAKHSGLLSMDCCVCISIDKTSWVIFEHATPRCWIPTLEGFLLGTDRPPCSTTLTLPNEKQARYKEISSFPRTHWEWSIDSLFSNESSPFFYNRWPR